MGVASEGGRSFEDILTAVEADEGLRGAAGSKAAEAGESLGGASDGASLVGAIPPELIAKLPLILKALNTMSAPLPQRVERPETPEALLCALRPYLNERRRQLLDTMIRIPRLSGTLGSLR